MRWISSQQRNSAIVLLDFEPDVLPTGELRLDLRVAFKYIAVRQEGLLAHADFYVACTSGSVQLDVEDEQIKNFTPGVELNVEYRETQKRTRASHVVIEPSVEFKTAAVEGKLSAGGVSLEAGSESVFERSFTIAERYLAAVNTGCSVIWRLDPPARAQAVRDFLFCNLHVYAVCTNSSGISRGRITVRPADLRFYGPDRRPYEKMRSLFLLYALCKARRSIFRPRGIEVTFSEGTT